MLQPIATFGLGLAAALGTPVAAPADTGVNREQKTESVLPAGSSEAFRDRMMDWARSPEPADVAIKERLDLPRPARLDRLRISSPFGWRSDPINGVVRHHAGIDLPAIYGSPVMATAAGVVRIAGWVHGYGNLVEIQHPDGVRTRYGHLSRLDVVPSEHVGQGQRIGEVGSTGRSTGPHLHYEVRVDGKAVDPLRFIGQEAPGEAQVYRAKWGPGLSATSRWVGWTDQPQKDSLPQSSIR